MYRLPIPQLLCGCVWNYGKRRRTSACARSSVRQLLWQRANRVPRDKGRAPAGCSHSESRSTVLSIRAAEGKTDLKLNRSAGDRVKRDSNWGPPRRPEPDREPNRSGPGGGGPIERRIELVPWAQVKSRDKRRGINGIKSFTECTGDIV